jgi:hypothetical protein
MAVYMAVYATTPLHSVMVKCVECVALLAREGALKMPVLLAHKHAKRRP